MPTLYFPEPHIMRHSIEQTLIEGLSDFPTDAKINIRLQICRLAIERFANRITTKERVELVTMFILHDIQAGKNLLTKEKIFDHPLELSESQWSRVQKEVRKAIFSCVFTLN